MLTRISQILLLLLFPILSVSADQVDVLMGKNKFKGEMWLNIPDEEYNPDDVEKRNIFLNVNNIIINNDEINLKGKLEIADKSIQIDLNSKLYKGYVDEKNILADVDSMGKVDNYKIVFMGIYNNPSKEILAINKTIFNQTSLVLYMFNEQNRDLLQFEIPLKHLGIDPKEFNSYDYSKKDSVSEAWYHRVMTGKLMLDEENFSIMRVTNSKNFHYSVYYASANTGYAQNQNHHIKGTYSLMYNSPLRSGDTVSVRLRITDRYVTINNIRYENYSAVWLGSGIATNSNPVEFGIGFTGYREDGHSNVFRDYIDKTKWNGVFFDLTSPSAVPELSLGVSYYGIGISLPLIQRRNFQFLSRYEETVFFVNGEYSNTATFRYEKTNIQHVNNYYDAEVKVGTINYTHGSPHRKGVYANIRIPIYGGVGGDTYIGEKTDYLAGNYYSTN